MYKITIERVEEKEVIKEEYQMIKRKEWPDDKDKWGYVSIPNIQEVTTELYSQSIEKDSFDIKNKKGYRCF